MERTFVRTPRGRVKAVPMVALLVRRSSDREGPNDRTMLYHLSKALAKIYRSHGAQISCTIIIITISSVRGRQY